MARKSSKEIPPWGRSKSHVERDIAKAMTPVEAPMGKVKVGDPTNFAADMPIGTNSIPSMARGVLEGGMPNSPRAAKGRLTTQLGKYGKNTGFPLQQ